MTFFKSELCVSKQHCLLCRQHTVQGERWRASITRVYTTETRDFDCPYGYTWLDGAPTPEDVERFARFHPKPGPKIGKKLKKRQFTRKVLAQRILENESAIRQLLPLNHPMIEQLNKLRNSERQGGCKGCRRRRLLRQIVTAVKKATDEEKSGLSELLDADLSNFSL